MSSIANSPDVLAAIQQRKRAVKKKLQASRSHMMDSVSYLTGGSVPKTANRVQNISRLILNALVIYRGLRFCSGVVSGVRSLFTHRSRRR